MKTAFAYWDNRIAPVFDTARQIHVVEAESGRIVAETQEALADDLPVQKALRLVELGVGTLVCGAISRPLHAMVAAYGIQVIPFVAGDLREVIQAWLSGRSRRRRLCHARLLRAGSRPSPGIGRAWTSGGTRHERKRTRRRNGCRRRTGARRGRGGPGLWSHGRSRPAAGARRLSAVCPKCGHREAARARQCPASSARCPKCGSRHGQGMNGNSKKGGYDHASRRQDGPMGMGAMSGRAAGYCAGSECRGTRIPFLGGASGWVSDGPRRLGTRIRRRPRLAAHVLRHRPAGLDAIRRVCRALPEDPTRRRRSRRSEARPRPCSRSWTSSRSASPRSKPGPRPDG